MKKNKIDKFITFGIFCLFFMSNILCVVPIIKAEEIKEVVTTSAISGITIPVIDGPSSININETGTFYVSASDSNGADIRYGFDWKYYSWYNYEFSVDEWTPYHTSGHTIMIDHKFEIGGNYKVAVIAENMNGEQSNYVGEFSISVNGGTIDVRYIATWAEPKGFVPNEIVTVCALVQNFGNRDYFNYACQPLVYFDGVRLSPFVYGYYLVEAGKTSEGGWDYFRWPDDTEQHRIDFYFIGLSATLNISAIINDAPITPSKPFGPNVGNPSKDYWFNTSTFDPNEHEIYYMFDWGDGDTSGWLGPYESNETIESTHFWHIWETGPFQIRVKAKDRYDSESEWSEPHEIIIEKSRITSRVSIIQKIQQKNPFVFQFLQLLQRRFKG